MNKNNKRKLHIRSFFSRLTATKARAVSSLYISEKERFSLGECLKLLSDWSLLLVDAGLSFRASAWPTKTTAGHAVTSISFLFFWLVFPTVSSSSSVLSTVQKSTQDRTIRAFIPAILLNLSQRLWLNIFVL